MHNSLLKRALEVLSDDSMQCADFYVSTVRGVIEDIKEELSNSEKTPWISTNDELPEYGKYILARHNRGSWHDPDDQDNVNCIVLKLVKARVEGNNQVPYEWEEFGPDCFFGQTITHWMAIPPLDRG